MHASTTTKLAGRCRSPPPRGSVQADAVAGFRRNYANDDKKMRLQGSSIIEKCALLPFASGR